MISIRTYVYTDPSLLRVSGLSLPDDAPSVSPEGVVTFAKPQRNRKPDNCFEKYKATIRTDLPKINLRQRTADAAARVEGWIRDYQAGVPFLSIIESSGVGRPHFAAMIRWYMNTDFAHLLIRPRDTKGRLPIRSRLRIRDDLPPLTPCSARAVARVESMIRKIKNGAPAKAILAQYKISRARFYYLMDWYLNFKPRRRRIRPPPLPKPKLRRGRKPIPSRLTPQDISDWRNNRVNSNTLAARHKVSVQTIGRWVAVLPQEVQDPSTVYLCDVI